MIRKTALAAVFSLCAATAQAVDGMSFEAGRGNDRTDLWRAGLQWNWPQRWFAERPWTLGAYWDLQLGRWSGGRNPVWDLSLTPVFRLERARQGSVVPYLEAAIGFHAISDVRVSPRREFSTRFQFGDHVGAGVRFGEGYRWDAGLRLQHLSNGGLRRPNPGINFLLLRLGRALD
jgi:lipid A 3-O-deacylase